MRTQIRNNPGRSSYFGNGYRAYGRYQWNVKYDGWQNEYEVETACANFFNDDVLKDVVGRSIKFHFDGRSGGWFVVDTELTDAELAKLDSHVAAVMRALPKFLREERAYQAEQAAEAKREEQCKTDALNNDPRVATIKTLCADVAGTNVSLTINGIRIL